MLQHVEGKSHGSQSSQSRLISNVIFDLDGTLLNTEGIMEDVLKDFLAKYEKQWDGRGQAQRLGKMPLEAAEIIIKDYQLPCTAEEFLAEILPWFEDRWSQARALPGANRFIKHLHKHGIPIALASNSPKKIIIEKISSHPGWRESFSFIIGGDEVTKGKPSPEIFLEAAKKLKAEPRKCLVIEDSFGIRENLDLKEDLWSMGFTSSLSSFKISLFEAYLILHGIMWIVQFW